MAEQRAAPGRTYDPLWDQGTRKSPRLRKAHLAIAVSIAAHIGLGYYIYETKFVVHYKEYGENALEAQIVRLPEPPAPPAQAPKPPPMNRQPPPVEQPLAPRQIESPLQFPTETLVVPSAPTPPAPDVSPPVETVQPSGPPTIVNPDWLKRPSGEDVAHFYPERALRLEVPGRAVLQCMVTAKGTVTGCAVQSEDPMGYGFGAAALGLSRLFQMKPRMENGQAVEGATVKIPIAFRIN